ncbi:MAG: dTDP-4-dehydrorhamnose 3,5-epimerase, partial [Anaerolineales bacterium]
IGEKLSAKNKKQLWIPPGFAHGFYVLSEWANLMYKVSDYYAPEWDRTLLWNDPDIGIDWPLVDGVGINISDKDSIGKRLKDAETFA